jgi:hypothetical protein
LPVPYLRKLIGSTIDLVVQINRLDDGSRKITLITEVQESSGGEYTLHDISICNIQGVTPERKLITEFKSVKPSSSLTERLQAHGFVVPWSTAELYANTPKSKREPPARKAQTYRIRMRRFLRQRLYTFLRTIGIGTKR